MAIHDNATTLKKGFEHGIKIIEAVLEKSLMDAADELLKQVVKNREYNGFTGNTQTSYACGVYINGKLVHVVFQHNWTAPTVRMKVRKGQVVFLQNPYEGNPRRIVGQADIVENHGKPMSLRMLEEYRAPRQGVALMMTTGTEYSTFLEEELGLDVLSKTKADAPDIIRKNWKKIDDSFWG